MTFYRRDLPHWHPEGKAIFITWRLFGSLPKGAAPGRSHWAGRNARAPVTQPPPAVKGTAQARVPVPPKRASIAGREFRRMDAELDKGATGPLWLRDPNIAGYVEDAIFRGEELKQHELDTYVVMPNHVHVLLWPWMPMPASPAVLRAFPHAMPTPLWDARGSISGKTNRSIIGFGAIASWSESGPTLNEIPSRRAWWNALRTGRGQVRQGEVTQPLLAVSGKHRQECLCHILRTRKRRYQEIGVATQRTGN